MLSRHESHQPLRRFRQAAQVHVPLGNIDWSDATASQTSCEADPYQLCNACHSIPFGADSSQQWKKAWDRSSQVAGALTTIYERQAKDLKQSAQQGCKWCTMLADATLQSLIMDKQALVLNGNTGSDGSGFIEEGEEEEEMYAEHDGEEKLEDDDDSEEVEEILDYDKLDLFDHCDISMSYLADGASSDIERHLNRLLIVCDLYASSDQPESVGLIGDKAVRIELQLDLADGESQTPSHEHTAVVDLSTDVVLSQAVKYLDTCSKHVACCSADQATVFAPSRLIEVTGEPRMCLRTKHFDKKEIKYVALSYVWGIEQQYVATTSWVEKGEPYSLNISLLPRAILNAIETTRKLGYSYLWVDAFCILQDSREDKRREISQMRHIFQNASLTIAAAKSASVEDAFLSSAHPEYFMHPFLIPFHYLDGTIGTASVGYRAYYRSDKDPWNFRAWTLEEQLLSPRLLVYSNDGLIWQCRTQLQSERKLLDPPQALLGIPWSPTDVPSVDKSRALWVDILCNYTQRTVTHPKDKLVALAAIAEEFGRIWGDEYLAGLWRSTLFEDLLWRRDKTSGFMPWLKLCARPAEYRAPSWSWAAIDGYVFGPDGDDFERKPFRFEILRCEAKHESEMLPFGAVVGGLLEVKGLLLECIWRSADPQETFCDGWLVPPAAAGEIQARIDPVADVQLDAADPVLREGQTVWWLPVAQVQNDRVGSPLEGLVLEKVEGDIYRRLGFFEDCHDTCLFRGCLHELPQKAENGSSFSLLFS